MSTGERRIWTRAEIGLAPPKRPLRQMVTHPEGAVLHCTGGKHPATQDQAFRYWRQSQAYHQRTLGWNDIGYSFGINDLGMVLEGRGWDSFGAHSNARDPDDDLAWNADRHGFCYQGDGENPTQLAIDAWWWLMGKQLALYGTAECFGHNEVANKRCPGKGWAKPLAEWNAYLETLRDGR